MPFFQHSKWWKKTKLHEVIIFNPKVKLEKWKKYPYVAMENVKENCFKTISKIIYKEYNGWWSKFENWDVIFARITPCLQNAKITQISWINKWFWSTEFFVFRNIPWITDKNFIFYLFCSKKIRDVAEKSMVGASWRQRADLKSIKNIEILLPPLPIQQKIASILSKYDDLIENNNKRIKILEQMAQAIYNEMIGKKSEEFLKKSEEGKELPEGWRVVKISDILDILWGFAFKSKDYSPDGKYKIVTIKNVDEWKFIPNVVNKINFIPDKMKEHCKLKTWDILLSLTGNVWRVCIVYWNNYLLNQRVAKLELKNKNYYAFVYLLFRSKLMKYKMENLANGVAQQNLSPIQLGKTQIVIPNATLIFKFNYLVKPILDQILNLQLQNQNLKQTRDLLIPRLVTGKLNVEDLEIV